MSGKEAHRVREFPVMDEDEDEYDVIEYQEVMERRHRDRPSEWVKTGPTWFRLADGSPVNKIDDDTFVIAASDRVLKRIR